LILLKVQKVNKKDNTFQKPIIS